MDKRLSLSVFFPCHNEQDNIGPLVDRTLAVLEQFSDDYEVILVNDGSTDGTAVLADQLAADHDVVRVVHHQTNKGYGRALQSGFRAAAKEYVFYTDGDGQFDIGELKDVILLREQADIVTCYRVNRTESFVRKFNAWGWSSLVNFLFKLELRDIDCAFKLYKREIFDQIEMHSTGALIDTEILARAKNAGYTMIQHGVKHYPRLAGQSSGAKLSVILRAFKELFALRKDILGTKAQRHRGTE